MDDIALNKSTAETETVTLYEGKTFSNWKPYEAFLSEWAKKQGFRMIKDRENDRI
ncbi:8783_t:CDS:2 [Scutellospora calospora]|uniref:8783_t:CDS:1 n=1 Tax=Scutellospora calospora TaxID=85575 RepID=A0ACA9JUQ2_9GLOM|nr:8783_t:CDS:2 [Scutellospora calospora]